MFECSRCSREVTNEEGYLYNGSCYCRACDNTIQNDPDYEWIKRNVFWRLINIET